MLWCCVTPERREKSGRILKHLRKGWRGPAQLCLGPPPNQRDPFCVWGQAWLAERIIPAAWREGRPFYQIDNGYWLPARGGDVGYYRIGYRGASPVFLKDAPRPRAKEMQVTMKPWRKTGRHVLLAIPGLDFGKAIGIDVPGWVMGARQAIARHTGRPIMVRERTLTKPLGADLEDCWALVTHSSNVATEAAVLGIPVFVQPTSPAATIGNLDLARLEDPEMPDREPWWNSLMLQQYTLAEMASGLACDHLALVRAAA